MDVYIIPGVQGTYHLKEHPNDLNPKKSFMELEQLISGLKEYMPQMHKKGRIIIYAKGEDYDMIRRALSEKYPHLKIASSHE